MAEKEIYDCERMVMRAQYLMSLKAASSNAGTMSDMEREDYRRQIAELLQGMTTLLEVNKKMGKDLAEARASLEKANKRIDILNSEVSYLKGKQAASNRHRYGDRNEKGKGASAQSKGRTKDEDENDYIEREGKAPEPEAEKEESTPDVPESTMETAPRDSSNRPAHYNTMHADVCVVHECDLDALERMGYTFLRYTRPLDVFDRISVIRQDRYRYVWVRDKDGNELPIFIPKPDEAKSRPCIFSAESTYDTPRFVAHTSSTSSFLSDLVVNRFQYAISSGREMSRMFNEKMRMSPQTIFNWLRWGAKELEGGLKHIKSKLLKPGSVIYCDETWVDVKVKGEDGKFHYKKRYMWVIVNLSSKVCYYLYGNRKRETIQQFLGSFQGTLMTDAYAAYAYFNNLKDCSHVCCWAHVRRIFYSALNDYKDQLSEEFVNLISALYKVELENIFFHRTEQEVVKYRKLESIPILSQLFQKARELLDLSDNHQVSISGKLHQALTYMLNHWTELKGYVDIGNVLIDNNCCERTVRPFANLRKSFGGFSSELGARVTAVYLTFIETCKLMKRASLDFFKGFFDMTSGGRSDYELITQELLC